MLLCLVKPAPGSQLVAAALVLVTVTFYETAKVCLTKGYIIHHEMEQVAIKHTQRKSQAAAAATLLGRRFDRQDDGKEPTSIHQFMVNGLCDDGNGFTTPPLSAPSPPPLRPVLTRCNGVYYPLHKNVSFSWPLDLFFSLYFCVVLTQKFPDRKFRYPIPFSLSLLFSKLFTVIFIC